MSPSTMELAPSLATGIETRRRVHTEPSGVTLEDVVLGAWEDLAARGRAECPVCGVEIEPGVCRGCGSELS